MPSWISKNCYTTLIKILNLFIGVIVITACGGGYDSPHSDSSILGLSDDPNYASEGRLLYSTSSEFMSLDLGTGNTETLLNLCCKRGVVSEAEEAVVSTHSLDLVSVDMEVDGASYGVRLDIRPIDGGAKESSLIDAETRNESVPKLTVDGSVIALAIDPSDREYGLSLVDRSGNLIWHFPSNTLLDSNGHFYNRISSWEWSKDGVLYIGEGDTIYKVDSSSSLQKIPVLNIPNHEIHKTMSLSPNDELLVFSMSSYPLELRKGKIQLYLLNLRTLQYEKITNSQFDVGGAAWSPDGRYLAAYKGVDNQEFTISPCMGAMFVLSMNTDFPVDLEQTPSPELTPVKVKSGDSYKQLCSVRGEIAWVR